MLNMRIAPSPLNEQDYEVILREYNRLASARIPMAEFVHCVQRDDGEASEQLVRQMRRFGLCARRIRTVMIHKHNPEFLNPKLWKINDSLFSFDP